MTAPAMPSPDATPLPPPLDRLFDGRGFGHDAPTGTAENPAGERIVFAAPNFTRSVHLVLQAEKPGAWSAACAKGGIAVGKKIGVGLDAGLARLGESALAALPLETSIAFIERYFSSHGWGLLQLDLTDAAEHGIVTGRLQHSYFVDVLADIGDAGDPLPAGILQGFFEHVSGQSLGCVEIACARHGAPHCTFVITAPERLESVVSLLGSAPAEAIIARLKT
jgi:hypothetical protein